jgi:hypothetical protein
MRSAVASCNFSSFMQISFDDDTEQFETKMTTFHDLVYCIESIGQVDITRLGLLFILLNLKTSHPSVHDALAPVLMDGTISLEMMESCMTYHFEMCNAHFGQHQLPSSPLALPAHLQQRVIMCLNCRRTGHTIEFCIAPGGQMEGLPMHEAMDRQHAAHNALRPCAKPRDVGSGAGTTQLSSTLLKLDDDGSVWIAGTHYRPDSKVNAALADSTLPSSDLGDYSDWPPANSADTLLDMSAILITSVDEVALLGHSSNPPFFLNSGASSHISCVQSDFTDLTHLAKPRRISGVGNASVFAVGVGTVDLILPQTDARLRLLDVLFAPSACVHLVSIHQLNSAGYITTFQSGRCHLADDNDATIADCAPGPSNLYALPDAHAEAAADLALPSLVSMPNLETWHRCLGHASHQTVLKMAQAGTTTGMPIDLSLAPQACDHCILGKQTHNPVLKIREGARATRWLEHVHIDLSGPHSVLSHSGYRYIMNFIDNFLGYNLTCLLKAKSDAFCTFCAWLSVTEAQSHEKLCYVLTDNGELCSVDMARWCAARGIMHQFTAPHTSAQNGRVECLHRTLMDKAHTMRLACNAPLKMWDKFVVTVSYLTTLTASHPLGGHTPHELWFGGKPLLSHLREIRCQAYVLISGNNPKIAVQSVECILIGYTPNSKAY